MELENRFTVPVGIDEAWDLLLDPERVALCMPGATLDGVDGDDMTGRVKVKLGPIALTYQGTARFVDRDDAHHTISMEASGKDVRGAGGAKAKMRMVLTAEGDSTRCTVHTDLAVTGKPAQFGRGVMADVSSNLVEEFARRLAREVTEPAAPAVEEAQAPAAPGGFGGATAQDDDAIDLFASLGVAGAARIAVPVLVAVVLLWLVLRRRPR
jgi:carbon monoxide dehydrogenase subunit G